MGVQRGDAQKHTQTVTGQKFGPPGGRSSYFEIYRGFSVKAQFKQRFNDKKQFSLEKQSTFPLLVFFSTV